MLSWLAQHHLAALAALVVVWVAVALIALPFIIRCKRAAHKGIIKR